MEPARGGKCAIDHVVGDAMVQRIEKPDPFAGIAHDRGESRQCPALACEGRAEIDNRDLRDRRRMVLDAEFPEQIHHASSAGADYKPAPERGTSRLAGLSRAARGFPAP